MAAYDLYLEFERSDDDVYFKGQKCSEAFDLENQGLIVSFKVIGKDLPKVDGILLLRGGIA